MRKLTCLRCDGIMEHVGRENLQLGRTGWILGDLPNLLAGALNVDIYLCPKCGKMEFFHSNFEGAPTAIGMKICRKSSAHPAACLSTSITPSAPAVAMNSNKKNGLNISPFFSCI